VNTDIGATVGMVETGWEFDGCTTFRKWAVLARISEQNVEEIAVRNCDQNEIGATVVGATVDVF